MSHHQEHNNRLRAEFTVWIERLIRNARTDYMRKLARTIPTVSFEDIPESMLLQYNEDDFPVLVCNKQSEFDFEEERLAAAFSKLPLMRQRILTMLFVEEKKPAEIAKQLHCSAQYVYTQRFEAIKKLRKLLDKGGDLD
ncbi:MAG TPA: sigma-70 family RNA polymerase sigma factor [Candidatus Ornithomonoglobus intestinigallinarum]|uniref:Sigma-70 family RNA polymerase sigma factor n=1 Tax=Candidatus Ornithomonoglobus intestinigallinarum TaxID=2840894 RepID=A0A9D1H2Z1_9FIRM|nr:sigma-70 family RNA polymerase sigma factor [Candidatus Ornithomonoglobus intestinigallinarum]